jgi:hypothetical protein
MISSYHLSIYINHHKIFIIHTDFYKFNYQIYACGPYDDPQDLSINLYIHIFIYYTLFRNLYV